MVALRITLLDALRRLPIRRVDAISLRVKAIDGGIFGARRVQGVGVGFAEHLFEGGVEMRSLGRRIVAHVHGTVLLDRALHQLPVEGRSLLDRHSLLRALSAFVSAGSLVELGGYAAFLVDVVDVVGTFVFVLVVCQQGTSTDLSMGTGTCFGKQSGSLSGAV